MFQFHKFGLQLERLERPLQHDSRSEGMETKEKSTATAMRYDLAYLA